MRRFAVRFLWVAAGWLVIAAPGCDTDLDRRVIGSACTRARDCMPELDCIAGECRSSADASTRDAAHDAASEDASPASDIGSD